MKIQKNKKIGGGGIRGSRVGGRGGSCWRGQGGNERRIEVFVEIQKNIFFWEGRGGVGGGGQGGVGGQVRCVRRSEVFVKIQNIFFSGGGRGGGRVVGWGRVGGGSGWM